MNSRDFFNVSYACSTFPHFRRIKKRRINVITTNRRPVPLEHFLYTGQDAKTKKDLFKIVDGEGTFLSRG